MASDKVFNFKVSKLYNAVHFNGYVNISKVFLLYLSFLLRSSNEVKS